MPIFFIILVASLLSRVIIHLVSFNLNIAAEANGLYGLFEWLDGRPLYPSLQQVPYHVYLYPPLHVWLSGSLLKLSGISSLYSQVVMLRLLSLGYFASAVFFLKKISDRLGIHRRFFWISLLLLSSKFCDYLTSSRNDMLALLLDTASWYFFIVGYEKGKKYLCAALALCCLSFWTRQSGAITFLAFFLILVIEKRWREAILSGLVFTGVNGLFYGLLFHQTHGAAFEHLVLSNLRGFRPLNLAFFDPSLIIFMASYALVLPLAGFGIAKMKGNWLKKILLGLLVSYFVFTMSVYLRAGGDVNYFFSFLFLCVLPLGYCLQSIFNRTWVRGLIICQVLIVAVAYSLKTREAYRNAFLPYQVTAQELKSQFPFPVFVTGLLSQGMGVYLRGHALHGPDVSNAGFVAQNAHPVFRGLLDDLKEKTSSQEISAYIVADRKCSYIYKDYPKEFRENYPRFEQWDTWLCVAARKDEPLPLNTRVDIFLDKPKQAVSR